MPWLGWAAARGRRPARLLVAAFILILIAALIDGRGAAVSVLLALSFASAAALVYRNTAPARHPDGTAEIRVRPPHALEQALDGVRTGLQARRACLWQIEPGHERARPWVVRGGAFGEPVTLMGDVLGWAARQGLSVRADPVPGWVEPGAQACAVAPVGENALLSVEFDDALALPAIDDVDRAAAYLATCVEYERERSALAHQSRRMEALMTVLRQLPAEIELQPLGHRLADAALHLASADGAAVIAWENESGRVVGIAGAQAVAVDTTVVTNESETALAAQSATVIKRTRREGVPLVSAAEAFSAPAQVLAALPLISKGGVVGVVTVWSGQAHLDQDGLEALLALAPYAALHFEHARAFGLLRERAEHDPLSGLLNRQAFDAQLAAESARFQRYQRPYSVLLVDIDHFKSINDRWGHQAGDVVLANIGTVLASGLRDSDQAARYGGEEFAILLPETDLAHALEIAERVRRKLAATESEGPAGRISITASLGVASCPQCARDAESLIMAADTALYRAKD